MFIPAILPEVLLPPLVALPPEADDEVLFVLLLPCANACVATTADAANAATIATIAIKFNLDIAQLVIFWLYININTVKKN